MNLPPLQCHCMCSAMINSALQDKGASSSMEAAMDLMQLGGIIRRAINLVTGAQIHVDETMFEFAVTSIIPGFKVCIHTQTCDACSLHPCHVIPH